MNIITMLPFLGEKEKEEIVSSILNNELDDEKFPVISCLPFLNKEQVDRLFTHFLVVKPSVIVSSFLPFVSENGLNNLVEKIEAGEVESLRLEQVLPFLGEDQIEKLFSAYMKTVKK